MLFRSTSKHTILAAAMVLTACDSSTETRIGGDAAVFLARSSNNASVVATSSADELTTTAGPIALSMVDSIMVRVTAVQAKRTGEDTASASGWVTLALSGEGGKRINLMALPIEGADSIRIARGGLPAGTYNSLRLLIADDATITLKQDVEMGSSIRLTKGTHPLTIPSASESGLKIRTASFTVAEDTAAAVTLVFEGATSVGNVTVTGNGTAKMSPVLRPK